MSKINKHFGRLSIKYEKLKSSNWLTFWIYHDEENESVELPASTNDLREIAELLLEIADEAEIKA